MRLVVLLLWGMLSGTLTTTLLSHLTTELGNGNYTVSLLLTVLLAGSVIGALGGFVAIQHDDDWGV